jgi:hypothetical protein
VRYPLGPAVAENQSELIEQNRMTSGLSRFAARLREFISRSTSEQLNFSALALELFALQFEHNANYRRICDTRHLSPLTITHWSQIPSVPTTAFKELEMTSLPPVERTHVFHSSGTTEQRPSRHFHNAESLGLYEASLRSGFPIPLAQRGRLLILTPPPVDVPNSSLVHMFEALRRESGAPESAFVGRIGVDKAWTIDFSAALIALNCNRRREEADLVNPSKNPPPHVGGYEPLLIFGTAFLFVQLVDFLAEKNLRFQLPPGSRVLETGGYKGRSRSLPKRELHALIAKYLDVPREQIICEYGMSELGSQAYDCIHSEDHESRHFSFPPWARVQIISPETGREIAEGEAGLIRVFDLANVFSVMAIQTEDLAVRRGNGFELIGRAELAESRGCSLMSV